MTELGPESPLLIAGAVDTAEPVDLPQAVGGAATEFPPPENSETTPPRRGVAGWTVYDLGNTLFSQNMIANYFPVWVVAVMGGKRRADSLVNTITMTLMLGIGPWLGADLRPHAAALADPDRDDDRLLPDYLPGRERSPYFTDPRRRRESLVPGRDHHVRLTSGHGQHTREPRPRRGRRRRARVSRVASRDRHRLHRLRPGGDYQTIFRLTAVGFFLLALPCFLWVKEPARAVERLAPLALARGAVQDIIATARRARSYPELVRFLVGRAFYAEAANTIGIFMAVLPHRPARFQLGEKDRLLLVADSGRRRRGHLLGPRRRSHRPAR